VGKESDVGDTSDFSLGIDVSVRLVLHIWALRVLDAVTVVQLSRFLVLFRMPGHPVRRPLWSTGLTRPYA